MRQNTLARAVGQELALLAEDSKGVSSLADEHKRSGHHGDDANGSGSGCYSKT
jgi:hypothetical protein